MTNSIRYIDLIDSLQYCVMCAVDIGNTQYLYGECHHELCVRIHSEWFVAIQNIMTRN